MILLKGKKSVIKAFRVFLSVNDILVLFTQPHFSRTDIL